MNEVLSQITHEDAAATREYLREQLQSERAGNPDD
jgi:hypothetical protein